MAVRTVRVEVTVDGRCTCTRRPATTSPNMLAAACCLFLSEEWQEGAGNNIAEDLLYLIV